MMSGAPTQIIIRACEALNKPNMHKPTYYIMLLLLERERLLPRKLTGLLDCHGSRRGDRQGSRRRKAKWTAAENSSSSRIRQGRSTGPVDRRAQHAQDGRGRPARSTAGLCLTKANSRVVSVDRPGRPITRDWQGPTLGLDRSTGPVDRSLEIWEVGRPAGRLTVGFWAEICSSETCYI